MYVWEFHKHKVLLILHFTDVIQCREGRSFDRLRILIFMKSILLEYQTIVLLQMFTTAFLVPVWFSSGVLCQISCIIMMNVKFLCGMSFSLQINILINGRLGIGQSMWLWGQDALLKEPFALATMTFLFWSSLTRGVRDFTSPSSPLLPPTSVYVLTKFLKVFLVWHAKTCTTNKCTSF